MLLLSCESTYFRLEEYEDVLHSSVGYELDFRELEVRFPAIDRNVPLLHSLQHPVYPAGMDVFPRGLNGPGVKLIM